MNPYKKIYIVLNLDFVIAAITYFNSSLTLQKLILIFSTISKTKVFEHLF